MTILLRENILSFRWKAFEVYCMNKEKDVKKYILNLDKRAYYMMNIVDYLIGNTDRHWGNWGVLVKNSTNKPVSLHKLMDFNQAFHAYDTLEGSKLSDFIWKPCNTKRGCRRSC